MNEFVILTENTADLPDDYCKENGLEIFILSYQMDQVNYGEDNLLSIKDFYTKMRQGAVPKTSAANPLVLRDTYQSILNTGKDILHLSFSSGLSSTYSNATLVASELGEEYPNQKIIVLDSLCASLGQGLLVHMAVQMKKAGKSIDEIANWLNANKLRLCHYFTVDDLVYLYRGGRVKRSSAILGNLINIKPVLHVDNEGHLIPLSKVRGRKKSLIHMVERMEENLSMEENFSTESDRESSFVFISHGDCEEDAEFVKKLVEERLGFHHFLIHPIGSSIGSHSGPGTVALFFFGAYR